jgi:ribosomal protein L37E
MTYELTRASCSACGALWTRSVDGPWRLIDAGAEPAVEGYACEGCGASFREQPRTCLVCGRPSRGVAPDRTAAELAASALAGARTEVPRDDPDGGMRAD